jgi:predicted O-methyltransferase YrrM
MANFLRLPHPVAAAALASLIVGGPCIAPMSVAFAEPGGHRERSYQNTTAEVEAQTATRRHSLESVLGREVRTRVEEDVGRIIDLLADRYGHVQAAVIEFGGFLGIGTRKIAVEWSALRFEQDGRKPVVIVELTRDELRVAPEYKQSEPAIVRRASE